MKRTTLQVMALAMSCLALFVGAARAGTLRLVDSLPFPEGVLLGYDLEWDGQHLYMAALADVGDGTYGSAIYELSAADGSVVARIDLGGLPLAVGVACDGDNLWLSKSIGFDLGGGMQYTWTLQRVSSEDGTVLWSHTSSMWNMAPQGLARDGTSLWVCDGSNQEIKQLDAGTLDLIHSFPSPGPDPRSITWDGASLWCVDGAERLVYQMDPTGRVLDSWSAPLANPYGIAFDGQCFWVLDNGEDPWPSGNGEQRLVRLQVPEPTSLSMLGIAAILVIAFATRPQNRHR